MDDCTKQYIIHIIDYKLSNKKKNIYDKLTCSTLHKITLKN